MLNTNRIIIIVMILILIGSSVQATGYIDKSQLGSGIIRVNKTDKINAVVVTKDGKTYNYILKGNDTIPLQSGNGDYVVQILEGLGNKSYKQIAKETVTLNLANGNDVYLQSTQMINWNKDMNAVKKAKELTKDAKTDREKVEAIYEYIVSNIKYDHNKASKIGIGVIKNYTPVIDETLKSETGICYDYSALMGGMLRAVGVSTKLVMGYKSDIKEYHSWNQVYIEETKEWIIVDTTYDASMGDHKSTMIKDAKEYTVKNEY